MTTIKDIATEIEKLVKKEVGATIEVTFRGCDKFTVSGKPGDVAKAKFFFNRNTLTSEEYDAELNETYAYYTTAA